MPRRESCQQNRGIFSARHAALILFRALGDEIDQMRSTADAPEAENAASWPRRAQCPQRTVAVVEDSEQEQVLEMTAPFGAFFLFLSTRWVSETPDLSLK